MNLRAYLIMNSKLQQIALDISLGYDLLYRRNALDGVSTAHGTLDTVDWEHFGPSRIVETLYGDGSLIAT